jgi:hypothetical protein
MTLLPLASWGFFVSTRSPTPDDVHDTCLRDGRGFHLGAGKRLDWRSNGRGGRGNGRGNSRGNSRGKFALDLDGHGAEEAAPLGGSRGSQAGVVLGLRLDEDRVPLVLALGTLARERDQKQD